MTSTIKLYTTDLYPEKNFILDKLNGTRSITEYLESRTPLTLSNFQYIKHGLYISIKVNRNQGKLETINDNNYNYVSILNTEAAGMS